jgi:excisionase family DNA binding protein
MQTKKSAKKLLQRQAAAVTEKLLRVRDVAERLAVSTRQVWKLASSGRLPAPVRLGRSVRWRASDIDRFIESGCPMSPPADCRPIRSNQPAPTTAEIVVRMLYSMASSIDSACHFVTWIVAASCGP